VRNRTRVESSLLVLVRLPSHRPKPTQTTSAPTSTRDEPHVGTHICGETPYLHFRIPRTVSHGEIRHWEVMARVPKKTDARR
jgi:hypothetical protein